jgi:hypothetical protein
MKGFTAALKHLHNFSEQQVVESNFTNIMYFLVLAQCSSLYRLLQNESFEEFRQMMAHIESDLQSSEKSPICPICPLVLFVIAQLKLFE